jgi:hypothetical protein
MVFLTSYRARFRYKVEWNRLNDATGMLIVKLKLSLPGARVRKISNVLIVETP